MLAALRFVRESGGELLHRTFDSAGATSVTGGLVLLTYMWLGIWAYDRTVHRLDRAAGGFHPDRGVQPVPLIRPSSVVLVRRALMLTHLTALVSGFCVARVAAAVLLACAAVVLAVFLWRREVAALADTTPATDIAA